MKLNVLLKKIRDCTICHNSLPLGANPIIQADPSSRILIIGQAPGTKAHNSNIPWNDFSGNRLREWLQLDETQFYNESLIAIMAMGFCYPGRDKNGGDKPPRPECVKTWHFKVKQLLPNIKLTLLVGSYAQKYYLQNRIKPTLDQTVQAWKEYLPEFIPLPHPSWRNTGWLKKNIWFEKELLPNLRSRIINILD
jgi:uracil-DNA glycosylase